MSEIIKITVRNGEGGSQSFSFEKEKISVGRDPKSDLVIDDIEISRTHLVITKDGDSFFAEDLDSTNGSFLNMKQFKGKSEITSGDRIKLGKDHVMEFVVEAEDRETELTPEPDSKASDAAPVEEVSPKKKAKRTKAVRKETVKSEKAKLVNEKKKKPTWIIILLAALAFIVIFCLVPLVVIEVTNQWCNLFAGFFNSMSPGVCP